ncbi:24030_t:CDS:2, partial [Gigaspora rosea]
MSDDNDYLLFTHYHTHNNGFSLFKVSEEFLALSFFNQKKGATKKLIAIPDAYQVELEPSNIMNGIDLVASARKEDNEKYNLFIIPKRTETCNIYYKAGSLDPKLIFKIEGCCPCTTETQGSTRRRNENQKKNGREAGNKGKENKRNENERANAEHNNPKGTRLQGLDITNMMNTNCAEEVDLKDIEEKRKRKMSEDSPETWSGDEMTLGQMIQHEQDDSGLGQRLKNVYISNIQDLSKNKNRDSAAPGSIDKEPSESSE